MEVETEVEKVMQAVANLKDGESYEYTFPVEYHEHIYRISVNRPAGIAVFYPNGNCSRTLMGPKRMRRFLRSVFRGVFRGKTGGESRLYRERKWWERKWAKVN